MCSAEVQSEINTSHFVLQLNVQRHPTFVHPQAVKIRMHLLYFFLLPFYSVFTSVILNWSYNYQDNRIMSTSYTTHTKRTTFFTVTKTNVHLLYVYCSVDLYYPTGSDHCNSVHLNRLWWKSAILCERRKPCAIFCATVILNFDFLKHIHMQSTALSLNLHFVCCLVTCCVKNRLFTYGINILK